MILYLAISYIAMLSVFIAMMYYDVDKQINEEVEEKNGGAGYINPFAVTACLFVLLAPLTFPVMVFAVTIDVVHNFLQFFGGNK